MIWQRQIELLTVRVLMITPFSKVQRGNSLTSARLYDSLGTRGFQIDLVAMDEDNWESRLRNMLAYNHYNIVHAFNAFYFAQVLESVPDLAWLNLVLTTTGTDINQDLYGPDHEIVLNVMEKVRKIVVFNHSFQLHLGALYPQLESRLLTIPQGVNLEKSSKRSRHELNLTQDNIVFLLPSGFRPIKNIGLAISALSDLHDQYPQIRLVIMGADINTEYSRQILSLIEPLDWIINLGEIPHSEIGGWMALGDVVLNTSDSEGQPQAALEAMSMGIPCILTAVPGNLGIIESGQEGFYVQNHLELIETARRLAIDPELRQQMGLKAQQLADTRFKLELEADAYGHLYRQIIGL